MKIKKYRIGETELLSKELFDTYEEAEEFIETFDLGEQTITEVEDEEVVPDEKSAMSYLDILRTKKDKGSEPIHYTNQPKKYEEPLTTSTYLREYYLRGYEALTDERLISCPFCQIGWSILSEGLRENLGSREQHQELESKIPLPRLIHIKAKHIPVYQFLLKSGIITQFVDKKADEVYDDHLEPVNPKNYENLSIQELAQRLEENPEAKKKFYRKWIESLQSR